MSRTATTATSPGTTSTSRPPPRPVGPRPKSAELVSDRARLAGEEDQGAAILEHAAGLGGGGLDEAAGPPPELVQGEQRRHQRARQPARGAGEEAHVGLRREPRPAARWRDPLDREAGVA